MIRLPLCIHLIIVMKLCLERLVVSMSSISSALDSWVLISQENAIILTEKNFNQLKIQIRIIGILLTVIKIVYVTFCFTR